MLHPRHDLRLTTVRLVLLCGVAAGFRCPGPEPQGAAAPVSEQGGAGALGGAAGMGGTGGDGGMGGTGGVEGTGGGGGSAGAGGAPCMDTLCGSECVVLAKNVAHCGGCGRACSNSNTVMVQCTGGICNSTCASGFINLTKPAAPSADDGCETPGRRVFVTAAPVLPKFGGALASDAICQGIANGLALGGTWMAWTSDATTTPATRFTKSAVPYRLLDGTPVAQSWADLIDGSLAHAIDINQLGTAAVLLEVWTGTGASGTFAGTDCLGWTTTDKLPDGMVGLTSKTDAGWTQIYLQDCDRTNVHLYCFEQ